MTADGTMLRQVDPRLLLLLAVVLMASIFSTTSWSFLAGLGALLCWPLGRLALWPRLRQRLLWLRWFFLFVIVLHLLFSPGHTLWGQPWLSYDGLWLGLKVSVQVILALTVSLVLAAVTTPAGLAAAAASLLSPLGIFGFDSRAFSRQILLTLYFVPLMQAEGSTSVRDLKSGEVGSGFATRVRRLADLVVPLLQRLITRADEIAYASASGREQLPEVERLPGLWPLSFAEWLVVMGAIFLLLLAVGIR